MPHRIGLTGIRWAQGTPEYPSFDTKHLLEDIPIMLHPQAVFSFLWVHFSAVRENEALYMKSPMSLEIRSWDSALIVAVTNNSLLTLDM